MESYILVKFLGEWLKNNTPHFIIYTTISVRNDTIDIKNSAFQIEK